MSTPLPSWLEPIVCLEHFSGDVSKYIDHVFSLFIRDFVDTPAVFKGKRVLYDNKDDNGKPAAFVHITTEENKSTGQRELCLRRCERIAWVKAIIENHNDSSVLVWEKDQMTSKGMATRIYLYLEQADFIVILQEIKSGNFIVTAIYVDYPHQKRKHLKNYQKFQNQQKR